MKSYVSDREINELGEALIKDYRKGKNKGTCVDIEGFITEYLKLNIVYAAFAEDDPNKIAFLSDGVQPLFIYEGKKKISKVFPKFTIILDKFLLRDEESGRRRFSLAHEAGHYLLCLHNPDQVVPSYRREYDSEREYSNSELSEMFSMNELFADKMAASLLMPNFILKKVVKKYYDINRIPIFGGSIFHSKDKKKLRKMSDDLGVSFTALVIRLKNLDYIEYRSANEYIDKHLQVGEFA